MPLQRQATDAAKDEAEFCISFFFLADTGNPSRTRPCGIKKNTNSTSYARETVGRDWQVAGLQNLELEQVLDLADFWRWCDG